MSESRSASGGPVGGVFVGNVDGVRGDDIVPPRDNLWFGDFGINSAADRGRNFGRHTELVVTSDSGRQCSEPPVVAGRVRAGRIQSCGQVRDLGIAEWLEDLDGLSEMARCL